MEMDNRAIRAIKEDGILRIALYGRMTYDTVQQFKTDIEEAIVDAEGYIIDLSKVEQIDSTGLGLLVNVAKHFIQNKNRMVIVNMDDLIQELFEISKLDSVFQICSTVSEAIRVVKDEDDTYWSRVMSF